MTEDNSPKTRDELLQECAPIAYKEIETFFARGMLVLVAQDTDIIDVALIIQADDGKQLEKLIDNNKVTRVHDEHAKKWSKKNPELLAVTVVPWLLVQELNHK